MRFKRIYIEITNCCNLNCRMCPGNGRRKAFMTPQQFTHLLEKINGFTEYIYLHVTGEPLFHPQLDDILTAADRFYKQVNIVTNGTMIASAGDVLLSHDCVRQVNFSVHSLWEGGRDADAAAYLSDLFAFADRASLENGPIVAYRVWTSGDVKQKEVVERILTHYGLPSDTKEGKGRYKGIILRDRVFLNGDDEFVWPDPKRIPTLTEPQKSEPKFCYGMRTQCGILVDGTVVPCCLDSEGTINLGNLFETDLETILASERAQAIYDGFTEHCAVEPLCQTCGFHGGTRVTAWKKTADI